jgi:ABC-2 type transport system ATP-binding protein
VVLTTHYMEEADHLCQRLAIVDHGRVVALDTPAALKSSLGADTIVTVKANGEPEKLATLLAHALAEVTRTRCIDGGVVLHVTGAQRLVTRVVNAAEDGGFDIIDVSVTEPTLETVFIQLTGKELRET